MATRTHHAPVENAEPFAGPTRTQREYKRLSHIYDLLAVPWLTNGVRREAVARLRLKPGDSALDLGCGTGLTLPFLVKAVGPDGSVVGVDLSIDQLGRARDRAEEAGWRNVTFAQANAEQLELGQQFDGILTSYTHDIMTSRLAVARAVAHLKPGGCFVALGFARPAGWRSPLNLLFVAFYNVFNVPVRWNAPTSTCPWKNLEDALGGVKLKRRFFGAWYRAIGRKPGEPESNPAK